MSASEPGEEAAAATPVSYDAHWSALLVDARDVIRALTEEVVRLRTSLADEAEYRREEEEIAAKTRAAELERNDAASARAARTLKSLDDGGPLDRDVLVHRLAAAEKRAADLERQLSRKTRECDNARRENTSLAKQREADLRALEKLTERAAASATLCEAERASADEARAGERAVRVAANDAMSQVREATRFTVESLQASLREALRRNTLLSAELDVLRTECQPLGLSPVKAKPVEAAEGSAAAH